MYRFFSFLALYSISINAFVYDNSFLAEIKPKINEQCYNDISRAGNNLRDFIVQAVSVLNAKTPGSMNGTHDYIGNYEGCLNQDTNGSSMQYCVFNVEVTYEKVTLQSCNLESLMGDLLCPHNGTAVTKYILKWPLCAFASCSKTDVTTIAKVLMQKSDIGKAGLQFKLSAPNNNCQLSMKPAFGTGAIIFFFIFGAITVNITICTIWHWRHHLSYKSGVKVPAFVRNWSVIENFSSLTETSPNDITPFHSLRVMTIYFSILVHEVIFTLSGPVANLGTMFYYLRILWNTRLDMVIDTCFAMGGFLTAHNLFTSKDKNIFKLALTRYFRFIPTFALVVLYITSVMEYTGRGPFWPMIAGTERDACAKHWWLALFMLGNYVPWSEHCWLVSWYIPTDFHFYIVGVLICRLIKNAKMGVYILSSLLIASIVYEALAIGYNDYTIQVPFLFDYMRHLRSIDKIVSIYSKSHFRISSYLVGMLGGYIAYVCSQNNKVLSKATIRGFLWSFIICALLMLSGLFYGSHSTVKAALHGSLLRPMWSFGVILFTLTFMFGKTNFPKIAAFFEMKVWVPLNKLTFCTYLVHMALVYPTIGNQVEPFFFCSPVIVVRYLAHLVLSLIVAFVLYLCVEKPSSGLLKLILEYYRNPRKHKGE